MVRSTIAIILSIVMLIANILGYYKHETGLFMFGIFIAILLILYFGVDLAIKALSKVSDPNEQDITINPLDSVYDSGLTKE